MRRPIPLVLAAALVAWIAPHLEAQARASQPAARTAADSALPRLDSLMSARDWRETGVARLTASERLALERWLARHSARTATNTSSLPAEPQREPEAGRVVLRGPTGAPAVGSLMQVTSVLSGGSYIVLADGTMWEVWSSDLVNTAQWAPGDRVLVRSQPAPPGEWFTLRFENGRARSLASVRYAGTAGPARVSLGDDPYAGETVFRNAPINVGPVYVPVPQYPYYGYDGYVVPRTPRYDYGYGYYGYRRNYLLPHGRDYDRHGRRPDPQPRNVGVRPRPRSPLPAPPTVSQPPRVMQPPRVTPAPRP